MAASMLPCRFLKTFNSLKISIIQGTECIQRLSCQFQPIRGSRRSCAPRPYFAKRKAPTYFSNSELTADNKEFLHEVVQDRYSPRSRESPLRDGPYERQAWDVHTMRSGVLAVKIGIIPQWTKDGRRFTTTMLQVLDNHVIRYVSPEQYTQYKSFKEKWRKNTYGSLVVGALSSDPLLFTKEYNNLFAEAGVPPKRKLTRFLISPSAAIQPGTPLTASHFKVGDYVDCQAKTIGHGFQGVVKRWGFKGGPASHGTTKWHRRPGNIGGGRNKAAVWKGRKLPGHMGMAVRTLKGLKIWRINTRYNVLYVTGQNIPGPTHCYVRVYDSRLWHRRVARKEDPPFMPTCFPEDITEPLPEDIYHEDLFQFSDSTITFSEDTAKKR